jgi:hypothetical protein
MKIALLPACVGPERQHILPLPTEKGLVGGAGTESTESKKKTQRKKRAEPPRSQPQELCQAGPGVQGPMWLLPMPKEPRRAAWYWSATQGMWRG